jgi:hypothetical protein
VDHPETPEKSGVFLFYPLVTLSMSWPFGWDMLNLMFGHVFVQTWPLSDQFTQGGQHDKDE